MSSLFSGLNPVYSGGSDALSNIYSTTATVIGKFFGENLYRKVLLFDDKITLNSSSYTEIKTEINIRNLIDVKAIAINDKYKQVPISFYLDINYTPKSIEIKTMDGDFTCNMIIIEYTVEDNGF